MAGIIAYIDYLSMQDETRDLFAKWTNSENYITENVGPGEIRPYLESAVCQDGTTKLIIGDSVCRQMFNRLQESNPEFTSSVLICYARALSRLRNEGATGCKTAFDIAPAYLSPLSGEELRAHML